MVVVVLGRRLFRRPTEVRDTEPGGRLHRRQLKVVDHHDAAGLEKPAEVDQVEKHAVEAVIPVDEGEVEPSPGGEEPGKRDLRLLREVLDARTDARVVQKLEAAAGESRELVRIDRNVASVRIPGGEQAVADEQRRDAVPEADFDRPSGALLNDPLTKCAALGERHGDGEDVVRGAIGAGDQTARLFHAVQGGCHPSPLPRGRADRAQSVS
jgi:hypothetical protein